MLLASVNESVQRDIRMFLGEINIMHYTSQDSKPSSAYIVATDYAILFGGGHNEAESCIL
jgi:hypothetical protein